MRRFLPLLLLAAPATAGEGFHPPGAYRAIAEAAVSPKQVAGALASAGAFVVEREREFQPAELERLRDERCASDEGRAWNREFCRELAAPDCGGGVCRLVETSNCGGVLVGGFFVTAGTCAELLGPRPARAKFLSPDGRPVAVPLERTAFTVNEAAGELSLLKISSAPAFSADARVRKAPPKAGEPVFSVGFPRRTPDGRGAHGPLTGGPRVSFGKAVASSRTAEDSIFADADSAAGTAGAPLFDRRGRLVGVAAPATGAAGYDPDEPARYLKAALIGKLIARLDQEERRLTERRLREEAELALSRARSAERAGRWAAAEEVYRAIKSRYGSVANGDGNVAEQANAALRFVRCETRRRRPQRTFPRVEYLESVVLSALSDGSRERLLDLLPCRARLGDGDAHSRDLITSLLEARMTGVPPLIREKSERGGLVRARLEGMKRATALFWRDGGDRGWSFAGAAFE
jgi:hypothetical protein